MSVGLGVGVFSWFGIIGELVLSAIMRWNIYLGRKELVENQFENAVQHLAQAETRWRLNVTNGKPNVWVKDYDRLILLLSMLADAAKGVGVQLKTDDLVSNIKEHQNLIGDKKNFIPFIGEIKKELKVQDEVLLAKIEVGRMDIRTTLNQKL